MEPALTARQPRVVLDRVQEAVIAISLGTPVVVLGDEGVGASGSLVFAAELAAPELVDRVERLSGGRLRVAVARADAERLDLRSAPPDRAGLVGIAAVAGDDMLPVDAREGVTTGSSSADRARTIALLASATARSGDFMQAGHVVPVRVTRGGVLRCRGHAEAALDLVALAGRRGGAAFSSVATRQGATTMAGPGELREIALRHGLALGSVDEIVDHRCRSQRLLSRGASATIPLSQGAFTAVGYYSTVDDREHVAFVLGDVKGQEGVLVSAHVECLLDDVLRSLGCNCRELLQAALDRVALAGRGVVVYLRRGERTEDDVPRGALGSPPVCGSVAALASGEVEQSRYLVSEILLDLRVGSVRLLGDPGRPHGLSVTSDVPVLGRETLPVSRSGQPWAGRPQVPA